VLLGITDPPYIVLKPLLIYNLVMAIIGLAAGIALWLNLSWAITSAITIAVAHVIVFLIVGPMFLLGGAVAMRSVLAMAVRSIVWIIIGRVAWKKGRRP
jgi:hypothetical protein